MADLEGQDHGPSSSSVGDNDDDFIVYSKEGDSKEAKVPSDPSPPPHLKRRILSLSVQLSQKSQRLLMLLNQDHGFSYLFQRSKELVLMELLCGEILKASSGKGASAPPTSKPKDKATEAGINYTDLQISQIRKVIVFLYHSVNVVVQTEHGLFVPVIRDADKKGLSKIADEVKSFTQKAKENSLKPEDYEGGTFLCQIWEELMGSSNSTPSSIPHNLDYLPSDQVIKGAIGAEWLKAFKGYVENPESMLL
ncbi:hypothetical protein Sjap_017972 [Stephania japonica]|uniref:2-oxoacid dehydrogenase acyltransferase catalytic domain-containing protein n=1 Tax=Stephania japonica TaxID=461633 RepID=A0AAP0NIV1_9MAGN